jgi:hypothetical protein
LIFQLLPEDFFQLLRSGSDDVPRRRQTEPRLGTAIVLASGAKRSSGATVTDVALPWVASLRSR